MEPGDAQAVADAVCGVLGNELLAGRLSAEARQRMEQEFSFEVVVRRTEELYRELLDSKTQGGRHAGRA